MPMVIIILVLIVGIWSIITYILQSKSLLPPGPPGLPIIGHLHMLGDLPHRSLHTLSQKYGPIMQLRLGLVPTVVVSSPEAAQLFLKTHDLNFASRPRIQASQYLSYGSKGVAFSQYGPYWRNLRKLCTMHLLSMSKIDSFVSLRRQEVTQAIKNIKAAADCHQALDISEQIGLVIEKITYRMIFGEGTKENLRLKLCVQEGLLLYGAFNISDYIPFMKLLDVQGFRRRLIDLGRRMDVFLEEIINEHEETMDLELQEENHSHRDFIDILLSRMKSTSPPDQMLDRTNIKAVALDMLAASMDTSSTTIEWALTELLRHPRVMERLQQELLSVIGVNRMVEEHDLVKLPYLDMVVKESMRLHPVAPLIVPRESINDITINGYHIAKNSRVIVNAWAIGRDFNAWSDNALEFYPERFSNAEIDVRGCDIQLIPFGSGRRMCPGMELGLRTVRFILAQLLHCFNLELPSLMSPSDVDTEEKFGLAVLRVNPLLVLPTYRLQVNNH